MPDTYSLDEFLAALEIKMGRTYERRPDYLRTASTRPEVQAWTREKRVPAWAYHAIAGDNARK